MGNSAVFVGRNLEEIMETFVEYHVGFRSEFEKLEVLQRNQSFGGSFPDNCCSSLDFNKTVFSGKGHLKKTSPRATVARHVPDNL